jgi:hypothetical protein
MANEYAQLVDHLSGTETVTVVTTRADGTPVAAPIWAVVVDGTAYVRGAYGERTAWFRRAVSGRPVAFSLADGSIAERDREAALADPRVAVHVEQLDGADPRQDAVSAAYLEKYTPLAAPEIVATVVSPESRKYTLALSAV